MNMTTPNSLMLNDFRIEKSLLPVTVTLVDGQTLVGDVFIQASARHRFEMEDATEVMNAAECFFPLRLSTGPALLVSKAQVRDVSVAAEHASQPEWSVVVPTPVRIQLVDGSAFEGKLCLEAKMGNARVLDHLNRSAGRFLALYRNDDLLLVAMSQIVVVRQLIDATA